MDAMTLACELVRIPSESSEPVATSDTAPEAAVLARLIEICRDAGLDHVVQQVLPGRDNLLVRLENPGAPRVLLTAHMDTVSARGMVEPFSGALRDGRVWGRGACDDKGPLAVGLSVLLALHRQKITPAYDITLAATVDEECSMAGAMRLAADLGPVDLAIGLEPTGLRIVKAHKGVYRFRVITHGQAAHSSAPEHGDNAILAMLPIIRDLERFGAELAEEYDPELGRPALSVTQIAGGASINIIPDRCSAGVDIRLLPAMEPEDMAARILEVVDGRAEVEEIYRGHGIRTDMARPSIAALQNAISAEGGDPEPITAAFATECAKLSPCGSCIVWGPGDIDQAHQEVEYVFVEQLTAACRILQRFLTGGVSGAEG